MRFKAASAMPGGLFAPGFMVEDSVDAGCKGRGVELQFRMLFRTLFRCSVPGTQHDKQTTRILILFFQDQFDRMDLNHDGVLQRLEYDRSMYR